VYASSVEDALTLLKTKIKFDNCVIEWNASDSHQPFLDMTLYKDFVNNTLQHMPYRKAGNHQERIPWISAHPYDVKRGTFLGEMSRLAVLSSLYSHYEQAMRSLVTLYINRGYPADHVHKWLYSNLAKRWETRLQDRPATEGVEILALKSQYNMAWNYFNASQLGDTLFGYWREWLTRADTRNFNQEFPAPSKDDPRVFPWPDPGEDVPGLFDLRDTNIFNSRVLVSRKRTRNILDLTNTWKKVVLENLEVEALADIVNIAKNTASVKRPFDHDVNTQVAGPSTKRARVDLDSDEQMSHLPDRIRYRSTSPTPISTQWRSGASGTWGRGSRA
jgi:hypothetical protein